MKAILQNFRSGEMTVAEVPPPVVMAGGVLVRTVASLISVGTERSVIELAKMNPLQKARARPDLVRKILQRASQEGLLSTAQAVLNRLSTPLPLGYSSAGVVEAVGAGISDLKPGDRVACAGTGYANHAEVVAVPRNLVTPIPDSVSFQDAAFVTLGAIALHGVRQAALTLGETVVVIGLGLVGQLTAQLCAAHGCRVFGIDTDAAKIDLAKSLGMDAGMAPANGDVAVAVAAFTRGRGADAVLITASTPSSEPIAQAAAYARDRARVVAVGDIGLNVPRRPYYDKELDIRLSRSYGPGRYDPSYEEKGRDYPIGYVRWTENRNMEAFLDLVAGGRVRLAPLITRRYPIEQAREAYDAVLGGSEPLVGVVLDYDPDKPQDSVVRITPAAPRVRGAGEVRIGVVGAGAFAKGTLLPLLAKLPGVRLAGVATRSGLSARIVADRFAADQASSDAHALIASDDVDAVLIATRHDTHAELVADALAHGKHVFVEKPLAVDAKGLQRVIDARAASTAVPVVLTGFNRRFSPLARELRKHVAGKPLVMTYRVNAGWIDDTSWVQDAESGGGRIVGEVCHFIDFLQFLAGADVAEVFAIATSGGERLAADPDNLAIQLTFMNGSVGSIVYASGGSPDFAKERLEAFGGGVSGAIDNWRKLTVRGAGIRVDDTRWLAQAKGHAEEMAAFVAAVRDGVPPIAFDSQVNITRATFAIQDSLREGRPVAVAPDAS